MCAWGSELLALRKQVSSFEATIVELEKLIQAGKWVGKACRDIIGVKCQMQFSVKECKVMHIHNFTYIVMVSELTMTDQD